MAELALAALYYLLMLAGSVSLGKVIFLLAGGGEGWAQDERATGLASITGFAVVLLAIVTELVFLRGSAFGATLGLGAVATAGSRAFLFRQPLSLSMPHLDQFMEEISRQEERTAPPMIPLTSNSVNASKEFSSSAQNVAPASPGAISGSGESQPTASQKIGEVIRLQGGKTPAQADVKPKRHYQQEDDAFTEIKWQE